MTKTQNVFDVSVTDQDAPQTRSCISDAFKDIPLDFLISSAMVSFRITVVKINHVKISIPDLPQAIVMHEIYENLTMAK